MTLEGVLLQRFLSQGVLCNRSEQGLFAVLIHEQDGIFVREIQIKLRFYSIHVIFVNQFLNHLPSGRGRRVKHALVSFTNEK